MTSAGFVELADTPEGRPAIGALVWWSTPMLGIYKARVVGYYRDPIFGVRATVRITERQRCRTFHGGDTTTCPVAEIVDRSRYRLAVSRTHYGRLYLAPIPKRAA